MTALAVAAALTFAPPVAAHHRTGHDRGAAPTATPTLTPVPTAPPSIAPSGSVTYESQAWWRKTGLNVPADVGAHIHVRATVPQDGQIVDGTITIPVRITLHQARGSLSWFRIRTESTELFRTDIALGPCTDCSLDLTATIDVGRLSTGRHELRLSANNPDEDPDLSGAQRMFQSTGYQVCVRACTPSYRSGIHVEARGWYTGHGYANARLESDPALLASGATIKVRLGPGADGLPTKYAGVFIDPDFHNGDAGTVVKTWAAAFRGSVTLPSLPAGEHRLVLVSSDGQSAGVLVAPFVTP